MSEAKKASKKFEAKLQVPNNSSSAGKKRAVARRKHRKLRLVVDKQPS